MSACAKVQVQGSKVGKGEEKTYLGERGPGDVRSKDASLVRLRRELRPDTVEDPLALLLPLDAREPLERIKLNEHPPSARRVELIVLVLAKRAFGLSRGSRSTETRSASRSRRADRPSSRM